jgi:hypothetical protein
MEHTVDTDKHPAELIAFVYELSFIISGQAGIG